MKLKPKKPLKKSWSTYEGLKKSLDPQVGHMPIRCHGAVKIIKVEVEALNNKKALVMLKKTLKQWEVHLHLNLNRDAL